MKTCSSIRCIDFPCKDVNYSGYGVPDVDIEPDKVGVMMISEAAPANLNDHYYAAGKPLFAQTTVQAFQDAGERIESIQEIIKLGVYLTTAIKCAKLTYGVQAETIKTCSNLLEQEIALFPNIKGFLLMGDVAIQAINAIARRNGEGRVIPAGSTYKIRGGSFFFRRKRVFPSYLQAGPSFFIEKSKRKMIAEDIAAALRL